MKLEAIGAAFDAPLSAEGFILRKIPRDDEEHLCIMVLDASERSVLGCFEAGAPEALRLTLSNGYEFHEFEWSEEFQLKHAANFATIALAFAHKQGSEVRRGLLRQKQVYVVQVGDEDYESRSYLSGEELENRLDQTP